MKNGVGSEFIEAKMGTVQAVYGISDEWRAQVARSTSKLFSIPLVLCVLLAGSTICVVWDGSSAPIVALNAALLVLMFLVVIGSYRFFRSIRRINGAARLRIFENGLILHQPTLFGSGKTESCFWQEINEIKRHDMLGSLLGLKLLKKSGESLHLPNKFENFDQVVETLSMKTGERLENEQNLK